MMELISHTANGVHQYFSGKQELTRGLMTRRNGLTLAIGDKVTSLGCDQGPKWNHRPDVHGMTVVSITLHSNQYGSHVQVRAEGGGYAYIESNEKFFQLALSAVTA